MRCAQCPAAAPLARRALIVEQAPKQVAPEPTCARAGSRRVARSAREHVARSIGDSAMRGRARDRSPMRRRRSGRPMQRSAVAAARDGSSSMRATAAWLGVMRARRTRRAVGTATPGLTSTAASGGKASGARQHVADAAHDARRADRGRPARRRRSRARPAADARIVERQAVGARQQPQRRGRVGRAAAEPGRDRQPLVERESARAADPATCARSARAALSTRLSSAGPAAPRSGRRRRGRARAPGVERQRVADVGERDQAFELVIAVGAAAEDAQASD